MAVFTVYFCGTGSNSFDFQNPDYHSGELVSTLGRNTDGMEFVNWIVVDGPGSGNLQEDEKFVEPAYHWTATGIGLGWGWDKNVEHALAMIHGQASWSRERLTAMSYRLLKDAGADVPDAITEFEYDSEGGLNEVTTYPKRLVTQQALQMQKIKIFRKNNPITQINVVGWSRGAVTAHMFANALAEDPLLMLIPVNMVAIDPVPGPFNFQWHRTTLPANVRRYVAFYARDERSLGFAPTVPKTSPGTQVTVYPMPGRHATLVGNAGNYIGGNGANRLFSPGRVVRMLVEDYLVRWGTPLTKRLTFSLLDMLRCYDKMIEQHDEYLELRKTVYTMSVGKKRGVGEDTSWWSSDYESVEQLKSDGVFVNWHHRMLFRLHFTALFRGVFHHGQQVVNLRALGTMFPLMLLARSIAPHTTRSVVLYLKTGKGALAS